MYRWLLPATALLIDSLAASIALALVSDLVPADSQFFLVFLPFTLILAAHRGAYDANLLFGTRRQLQAVLPAICIVWLLLLTALASGDAPFGERMAAWFTSLGTAALLATAGRIGLVQGLRSPAAAGLGHRVVLIGSGPRAARFAATARRHHRAGMVLLGIAEDLPEVVRAWTPWLRHLGTVEQALALAEARQIDGVVLADLPASGIPAAVLVQRFSDYGVDVRLAPGVREYVAAPLAWGRVDRLGLRCVADRPMSGWRGLVKAATDYLLATLLLAIAAVPMALIAVAIRYESPGPVLFRQSRIGRYGHAFTIFKFRTMQVQTTTHEAWAQATAGDPRMTRVGVILRRTSLDELPQLLNVLRGEMSFVGPRPHAPGTCAGGARFEDVATRYAARHRVKPGLTGLAQVRGWRGPTLHEDQLWGRLESDLEYIETWSLGLDLAILFRTLWAVAGMRNAV